VLSNLFALLVWASASSASGPSTEPAPKAAEKKRAIPKRGKRGKRGKGSKRRMPGKSGKGSNPANSLSFQGSVSNLSMLLSRGRYRQAMMETTRQLAESPLDPDLHASRAVCCSEFGDYPCVQASLDLATGSEALPMQTVVAEADALRFLGEPEAAARIRRELVVSNPRPKRELATLTRLFGDHKQAGNLEGMWEVALESVALQDGTGVGYALLARTYAVMGDLDEAEAWIWIGYREPNPSSALAVAEAEVLMAAGETRAAVEVTDALRRKVLRNRALTAVRGRALLSDGELQAAVDMLDLRSWYLGDELWHPDLIAVQAVVFAHNGWEAPALDQIERLESAYSGYPAAAAAAQEARDILAGTTP